jgi:hypothetical protein
MQGNPRLFNPCTLAFELDTAWYRQGHQSVCHPVLNCGKPQIRAHGCENCKRNIDGLRGSMSDIWKSGARRTCRTRTYVWRCTTALTWELQDGMGRQSCFDVACGNTRRDVVLDVVIDSMQPPLSRIDEVVLFRSV